MPASRASVANHERLAEKLGGTSEERFSTEKPPAVTAAPAVPPVVDIEAVAIRGQAIVVLLNLLLDLGNVNCVVYPSPRVRAPMVTVRVQLIARESHYAVDPGHHSDSGIQVTNPFAMPRPRFQFGMCIVTSIRRMTPATITVDRTAASATSEVICASIRTCRRGRRWG